MGTVPGPVFAQVCLYGWLRGSYLKAGAPVHLPGLGDLQLRSVSVLPDPCPFPDKAVKRSLNQKERVVYAPFSGLGGVVYDKDAIYVETGGAQQFARDVSSALLCHAWVQKKKDEIVEAIADTDVTMDEQLRNTSMKLLHSSRNLDNEALSSDEEDEEDDVEDEDDEQEVDDEEDLDDEEEEEEEEDDDEVPDSRLGKVEETKDGLSIITRHSGDFSGLVGKSKAGFTLDRRSRIRWKDLIYGGRTFVSAATV